MDGKMIKGNRPAVERFWLQTDKRGDDECWPWRGFLNGNGRGRFRLNGVSTPASRASWMLNIGEIPPGLVVCHSCDNPKCVNPNHLWLGTIKDNQMDAAQKMRLPFGDAHHKSKLTSEKVKAIRERFASGERAISLASEYGVREESIHNAVARRTWRHV